MSIRILRPVKNSLTICRLCKNAHRTTLNVRDSSVKCRWRRYYTVESNSRADDGGPVLKVLGIETSCDDTGAAVVDSRGNILGECLHSQNKAHLQHGGIIPSLAKRYHQVNIHRVVQTALQQAKLDLKDVDAIATTVKPGLTLCLQVGLDYTKYLVQQSRRPFLPIHHMEAHALTVRLIDKVEFPFLVLLVSGGHCLLLLARDVDDFLLLGKNLDDAPGEAFDKTARSLKLKLLPDCEDLSGGRAIEMLATSGNPRAYDIPIVLAQAQNCDFSFSGLKASYKSKIEAEERRLNLAQHELITNVSDVCASFQYAVLHHLAKRVQRALIYCEMNDYLPQTGKQLVVSGGVASNMFIRGGLSKMCEAYDCQLVCPPPSLCTDNGIMIAWNGIEKLRLNREKYLSDVEMVEVEHRSPIGVDIRHDVESSCIKLKTVRLL
ncbi:tRNA N6-adenosine threonylcarbamoyltransferase, mitochondrial-like [Tubulanus polymorphus]|uniref:tRNA N6-adenosine threonylcarbamoyltransferase, mitochondrial-like n=1 Tax=Tubulanus polymorphus TaxID=672921 RepID=UPI003DA48F8A